MESRGLAAGSGDACSSASGDVVRDCAMERRVLGESGNGLLGGHARSPHRTLLVFLARLPAAGEYIKSPLPPTTGFPPATAPRTGLPDHAGHLAEIADLSRTCHHIAGRATPAGGAGRADPHGRGLENRRRAGNGTARPGRRTAGCGPCSCPAFKSARSPFRPPGQVLNRAAENGLRPGVTG
ncbi:hypothetical protein Ssi02_71890 [Sinosporangium siamense]|uniref:Uncharacterized protein n=1 Tax=Sinosporangium siamense TaxID=1367973 RepID=A0A919RNI2_9ACTN|nr:hypothetical protein Ssi02_71890 [Sinosporangium siamense]